MTMSLDTDMTDKMKATINTLTFTKRDDVNKQIYFHVS